MIDLKKRKSDWSATSAKGGQFESAETDQFGRHVHITPLPEEKLKLRTIISKFNYHIICVLQILPYN